MTIIKKMMIMVVVLTMIVTMSGFAYVTEEAPNALIEELREEGFIQSETDENLWIAEEEWTDTDSISYATIYAVFNTDTNIGVLTVDGEVNQDDVLYHHIRYVVRWNCEEEDFETIDEVWT